MNHTLHAILNELEEHGHTHKENLDPDGATFYVNGYEIFICIYGTKIVIDRYSPYNPDHYHAIEITNPNHNLIQIILDKTQEWLQQPCNSSTTTSQITPP